MAKNKKAGGIVGFIGGGKMGEALISGMIRAGFARAGDIIVSDPAPERRQVMSALGVALADSNRQAAEKSSVVVIAVKPNVVAGVLSELAEAVGADKLVVSIAAGVTIARIQEALGPQARVIRAMPNTPCLVGEGATAFAAGANATEEDCRFVESMFKTVGICFRLEERLLDAATGLSGSGPAYVFTVIEALSDGGVLMGLPRHVAQALASQTVLGAAKMARDGIGHPAQLREAVTSPGGTTAEGLFALEKAGIRAAFAEAVRAATLKAAQLGKQNA